MLMILPMIRMMLTTTPTGDDADAAIDGALLVMVTVTVMVLVVVVVVPVVVMVPVV